MCIFQEVLFLFSGVSVWNMQDCLSGIFMGVQLLVNGIFKRMMCFCKEVSQIITKSSA